MGVHYLNLIATGNETPEYVALIFLPLVFCVCSENCHLFLLCYYDYAILLTVQLNIELSQDNNYYIVITVRLQIFKWTSFLLLWFKIFLRFCSLTWALNSY